MTNKNVQLHVYLHPSQIVPSKDPYVQYRIVGSSAVGMRAEMLYIHGSQKDWESKNNKEWLVTVAMTRLIDGNPARVVWCHG